MIKESNRLNKHHLLLLQKETITLTEVVILLSDSCLDDTGI